MKKKVFSLMMTLVLAFIGAVQVQAQVRETQTFDFEDQAIPATWTNGTTYPWTVVNDHGGYCMSSSNSGVSSSTSAIEATFVFAADGTISFDALCRGEGTSTIYDKCQFFIDGTQQFSYGANVSGWNNYSYEVAAGSHTFKWSYSKDSSVNPTGDYFRVDNVVVNLGGGGDGTMEDKLHVKYMDGDTEVIDSLNLGVRPAGCWMAPFEFTMYSEGPNYTVNVLDFTPSDGMFAVEGEELPFQVAPSADVDLLMSTTENAQAGLIQRQFVAITEGIRAAHIWPVVVEMYDPQVPDVVEYPCEDATTFPFVETPIQAHNTTLHNDYTLPFPEIPEGYDAVYKLVFDNDMMLNASVTEGENGKVALYLQEGDELPHPMADNNYNGPIAAAGGSAAGAPFEAHIGEGTNETGLIPFYCFYNYSMSQEMFLAAELEEAGVTTAPMTSLSWYCTATNGNLQSNITIWMANVEETAIGGNSIMTGGMTKVYTGNMTPTVGWDEFVFNEGTFAWDGHSNILISVQRNNGAWASGISWQCGTQSFTASGYSYNDSQGAYNMETNSYVFGTSGSSYGGTTTTRSNTMFKGGNRYATRRNVVPTACVNPDVITNVEPARDGWLAYDNGEYATSIGNTTAYDWTWATMYPASMLGNNNTLTKVAIFNTSYNVDDITIDIYQGGTTEPGTLIASKTVTPVEGLQEVTLNSPVTINPSQNLWIVLSEYGTYVLTACNTTQPNNQWVENDGWYNIGDLAATLADYGWMIRAYVTNSAPTPPTPPTPTPGEVSYTAGPVIEGLPVTPGTYYLVASSTTPNFEVTINAENMPCPTVEEFAFAPQPADNEDEVEPASVTLRWMIPEYATAWRLVFGSTYHPEEGHPQTIITDWSNDMANSYTVRNLWNNTNYFWRVEFKNDGCPEGVSSPVWGFTTHLNVPQGLTVVDETVFNDEQIVLNWNAVVDRTYRMYNVYRDGELIGHTNVNNIGNTTYTDGPLPYNMDGYNYYVTAVYDEGESAPSNTVNVKVSGYGDVNGHVFEQDGTTGIANATVTMVGQDEFGVSHTYNFQTNAQGYYTGHIYAGAAYDGQAAKDGYQTAYEPVQGEPIVVNYNETASPYDYILDENFDPVCTVIAEYYPDSLDPTSPFVKVYWGCGLPGEEIVEPFETGDFSMFDWQLDNNYPWSITTTNPYEGTYCMKSGGAGVPSVVSNMTVTVNIPADGVMSYFGKISCESNWDYGYFYIDGVQKAQYTGVSNWAEKSFDITAGDHTFMWQYTKDASVNSNDDCFYVDFITFYKRPEPPQPAQPGWHTYAEGDFNNAVGSNVGTSRWAYEYPVSLLGSYAGFNLTKVSLFSDNMYSAVGGNYTCTIYQGGDEPMAGTAVSTITVDVPANMNAWVDFDLTTPVSVTGNAKLWVVWTANSPLSSWPAGCCDGLVEEGTWWSAGVEAGYGWEHETYGTWTMRQYFTNREGRGFYSYASDNAPVAVEVPEVVKGAPVMPVKGVETVTTTCANPNAVPGTRVVNRNTRSLEHYRVYRTNCYNDGPYTEENTALLATVWMPDTVYIDVEWADLPAGVYKWGVGAVYSGNRGEEIAGPIHWSEPVNVNNATREAFNYGFEGGLEGWTVIDVNAGEGTWVHSDNNPGGYDYSTHAHGGTGFAMCYSFVDYVGSYDTDSYLVSPQKYSIADGSNMTFWADNANDSYPETFSVCVATAANPTAADFTAIWSGAAKGNRNEGATVRRDINRYDNWRSHTIDLSAYAGQEVWIAFHDVNYDAYEVWIDDVTINAGGGSGPVPPTPPTPGTGGLQLPRESEIVWSNCLDKDMWLGENDVDINVLLNSADSPEGIEVSFVNLNEAEQELYPIDNIVLDETGFYAWDTFRKGDYQLTITRDGYETITENVSIWEPTSMRYVMIEIIYGVSDLYVSRTGWAMWEGHGDPLNPTPGPGPGPGPQPGGSSFEFGFEDGFEGWTTIDNDGDGLNWVNSVNSINASGYDYTGLAHGGNYFVYSQSYIDYDGAYDADNYLVSPQKYSIGSGSTLSFWADNANDSYPDHFAIAISTADTPSASSFTDIWSHSGAKSGEKVSVRNTNGRYENWRSHSVDLSAYAGQDVWIAFHHQDYDEYEIWIDDVTLTSGAKSNDRHLEYYKVMCESIDHEPIFNVNTPYNFCQVATDELEEGQLYICKVAAVYSTGMSDYAECIWEYESCENYAGTVNGLTVNGTTVTWDYPGTPGPGPQPGPGDSFSVNFDDGQIPAGWTMIDANNDNYNWVLGSQIGGIYLVSGASLEGSGHNSSTDLICSGSYSNATNQAITPDNYLVSPQVNLAAGSTFSFWACAQDAGYAAEHFGVFISDNGTSDWTMVQEWTMTAKSGGAMSIGRGGQTRAQGNWYNYSVDLSAFAGQKYIAIRHFNCNDQFILDVDDIELTSGAKSSRNAWDLMMTFNAPEGGHYGVVYDGNNFYTSNWGYSSAAHNFYKYDQQGNMIEGFEIPGCGTLRGMTFDGQYIYGVANSNTVYCVDMASHSVVSTFTSAYGAMRGITYDPVRDGFWVIGNWAGNLTLIDRTGAIVQTGPEPESASDLAYYKDENDVEHVFCFDNLDNGVYDYNITTNSLGGSVFNFSNVPGFDGGSSGGCHVGSFNGKIAFIGDIQQSPNLIGVYELRDDNGGPTPPPTPTGDILGAMVFLNGEWEAFVAAPTNSYEFPSAGEYCVRIVYNGTNELPSNNFFYAMSCEECEGDVPPTCEPGDPIHAEVLGATDQVRIWWGVEPAAPIEEWLYYDDGEMAGALGAGGAIYWAIMFPASSLQAYAGTSLTQVAVMEYDSPGNYTANIYLGGTSAPATLVSTQEFSATGTVDWKYVTLDTPVAIDGTQNLWITMYQAGITYPATACVNTGDPNGRWVSTNGTQWIDVTTAGDFNYTWLIRGFVTNQAKGGQNTELPEFHGEVGGELSSVQVTPVAPAFAPMNRANIVKYNVYRSNEATGNYVQIGEVAEAGQTLYEYFDTPDVAGMYYYQVTAVYDDGCESAPALAADDPTHNYVSASVDAIGENSDNVALYPNPTKGNVTIEANGMSRITVVSVLGQVVYDTELNADVYTLNMSQFNAGMYMVRIHTENGVIVKRVTVMQ